MRGVSPHSFLRDAEDIDLGVILAVSLAPAVMLAAVQLEDAHLVAPAVLQHPGLDLGPGDERRTHLERIAVGHQQHLVEHDFLPDVGGDLLDFQLLTGADPVLFAAGLDYRVHETTRPTWESRAFYKNRAC